MTYLPSSTVNDLFAISDLGEGHERFVKRIVGSDVLTSSLNKNEEKILDNLKSKGVLKEENGHIEFCSNSVLCAVDDMMRF